MKVVYNKGSLILHTCQYQARRSLPRRARNLLDGDWDLHMEAHAKLTVSARCSCVISEQ